MMSLKRKKQGDTYITSIKPHYKIYACMHSLTLFSLFYSSSHSGSAESKAGDGSGGGGKSGAEE